LGENKTIAQDVLLPLKSVTTNFSKLVVGNYRNINLDSIVIEEVREIRAESLCYQAIEQLDVASFLQK